MKNMHKKILFFAVAAATLWCVSCQQENYLAEESRSMMLYQKNNTDGNLLALAKAQGESIARTAKDKNRQPGRYADYAVSLAKLGLQEEANRWFNKERATFPASKKFVDAMKAKYAGSFATDTVSLPSSNKPDDKLLASFMFNDADETLEPVLPDVSDDFSDDPASIEVEVDQNPLMSDKEVEALQRSKRAVTEEERNQTAEERAKAKKEAAKAKEKAKKQAQKEKEKAKKQAQKEKEQAKKLEKQQKEAAKKQSQMEKEAARKQAAKEKEAARQQAAEEKQRQREQQALQREQERARAAEERQRQREEAKAQRERERAEQIRQSGNTETGDEDESEETEE